jgi:hypothetical protein
MESTCASEHSLVAGWTRKGHQLGLARAKEIAILDVLEAHGVELPHETRDLVAACTHPFTLVHRPLSPLAKQSAAEGEAGSLPQGLATALLNLLEARGIDLPGTFKAAIANCTDVARLRQLIRRAVTAVNADDLYECLRYQPEAALDLDSTWSESGPYLRAALRSTRLRSAVAD